MTRVRIEEMWPSYRIEDGSFVGLFAPQEVIANYLKATPEVCLWNENDTFRRTSARNIAATLLTRSLRLRLLKAGLHEHPKRAGLFYLIEQYSEDGKLRFTGYTGRKTWLKIRGRVKFYRQGGRVEVNYHHFGFRVQLARGLSRGLHIQVTPTIVFFDEEGHLIADESVGPRRRKLTKNWWNGKWLNRLRAAEQLLTGLPPLAGEDLTLEPGLISLVAPVSLMESELLVEDDEAE
jgi:hypothetical protein